MLVRYAFTVLFHPLKLCELKLTSSTGDCSYLYAVTLVYWSRIDAIGQVIPWGHTCAIVSTAHVGIFSRLLQCGVS